MKRSLVLFVVLLLALSPLPPGAGANTGVGDRSRAVTDTRPTTPQPPVTRPNQITITPSGFEPATVSVAVGTEVTWSNATAVTRTLAIDDAYRVYLPLLAGAGAARPQAAGGTGAAAPATTKAAPAGLIARTLAPGATFSHVFRSAGEHRTATGALIYAVHDYIDTTPIYRAHATPLHTGRHPVGDVVAADRGVYGRGMGPGHGHDA